MLRFIRHFRAWVGERCRQPGGRIALLALAGALLSSYPVVFLGQSFVSPYYGTPLLYEGLPALPGAGPKSHRHVAGSDVGALMWQHVPYATIQHRSLVEDGTWPVWNRYNSGGTPLLGQGQSMLGDPLHWPVILARSAAWAWDLKFLTAKFLLALALGRLVWELTRHLPAGLITAGTAPFVGVFVYYVNHPAIFSFCYAAVLLYVWWRLAQAESGRAAAGWSLGLVLANYSLFHSGTVKDAVLLLAGVSGTGALLVLAAARPWRERGRRLAVAGLAGGVFVLLAAPTWVSFLATLRTAYTSYDGGGVLQVQPALLLGAFEEALFRPVNSARNVYNPSVSFLVLGGLLYLLASWRTERPSRAVLALGVGMLAPLALVFGAVPASWILGVPFLDRVVHLDDIGLCLLALHWTVLAGVGFAAAGRRLGTREGARDLRWALAGLGLLLAVYAVWGRVPDRAASTAAGRLVSGEPVALGGFVSGYVTLLVAALGLLAWLVRRALQRGRSTRWERTGFVVCGLVLLWRPALHAEKWFATYAVRAGPRMDFHARSPAVDWLRAGAAEKPARVIGLGRLLFPGWTAVYALEGIGGPDALMHPGYRALMRASPLRREWDWRYEVTADNVAAARAYLDFLNVRYYAAKGPDERMAAAGLVLRQEADLAVYESPTAWPRAFFCGAVERLDTVESLVARVGSAAGRPFAAVTGEVLAGQPELAALLGTPEGKGAAGRVIRCVMAENATQLDVEASGPGLVVLTETWWPGMSRVRLNDGEAEVVAVNGAFHGVLIPSAGRHQIRVDYRPPHFGASRAAAGAGLVLLAMGAVLVFRRPRAAVVAQRS